MWIALYVVLLASYILPLISAVKEARTIATSNRISEYERMAAERVDEPWTSHEMQRVHQARMLERKIAWLSVASAAAILAVYIVLPIMRGINDRAIWAFSFVFIAVTFATASVAVYSWRAPTSTRQAKLAVVGVLAIGTALSVAMWHAAPGGHLDYAWVWPPLVIGLGSSSIVRFYRMKMRSQFDPVTRRLLMDTSSITSKLPSDWNLDDSETYLPMSYARNADDAAIDSVVDAVRHGGDFGAAARYADMAWPDPEGLDTEQCSEMLRASASWHLHQSESRRTEKA